MYMSSGEKRLEPGGLIKGQQDFFGGLFIVGVSAFALWFSRELPVGTLGGMGPGMMPRSVSVLLGALGAMLVISSLFERGERLSAWSIRGTVFVLAAIMIFAYTVRPLGLSVAAPLCILVGACASDETRWGETILFSVIMTALCVGLFKYALNLPIPLAPWLLGY
jgi:putative tricarboxylic transport membrane protein